MIKGGSMDAQAEIKAKEPTGSWTRNTLSGIDTPNIFTPAKILFSEEATHRDHPSLSGNIGAST